jgi:hypothetical protein
LGESVKVEYTAAYQAHDREERRIEARERADLEELGDRNEVSNNVKE